MTSGRAPTPQWRKLGLQAGHRLLLDGRPAGWTLLDPPMELDIEVVTEPQPVDVAIGFVRAAADLAPPARARPGRLSGRSPLDRLAPPGRRTHQRRHR